MKLRILHRTFYRYSQPVRNNTNEVRLTPLHNEWQDRQFHLLRVLPSTRLRRFTDLNFNWVNQFEIEEAHERLTIEVQSTVKTRNPYADGEPCGATFEELAGSTANEDCHPFLQASRYVQISPEIWRAAVDGRGGIQDVFQAAQAVMTFVHSRCIYQTGVTGITTTSEQFFHSLCGVCQDFTHLMLAMCRALEIPARYVSGYLYDTKRRETRGAHASHAWVEVYVPGRGWFGIDPTNARLADHHYVRVAVGRDYDDVAPVKGSFVGNGSRTMEVAVHIEEV